MARIERTAEILDTATGQFMKTGKGATFIGSRQCQKQLEQLRKLDRGRDARFVLDWHDENYDILETFGIDERGFLALTGERPKSPQFYTAHDARFWKQILAAGVKRAARKGRKE